jgi:hypothetical protein
MGLRLGMLSLVSEHIFPLNVSNLPTLRNHDEQYGRFNNVKSLWV